MCLVHKFKPLLNSYSGLAYCLEALVYRQVFNAFFTGGRLPPGEFFFHNVALEIFWLFFSVPFSTLQ